MALVLGLSLLVTTLYAAWMVSSTLMIGRNRRDALQIYGLILCSFIVLLGYAVSAFHRFGQVAAWLWIAVCAVACIAAIRALCGAPLWPGVDFSFIGNWLADTRRELRRSPPALRAIFMSVVVAVVAITLVKAPLAIIHAPINYDSMTCHLARMAYFLQYNSLAFYSNNYAAQVIHGRVAPVLVAFTFLSAGREENLTQLVQFCAYFMMAVTLYAMALELGCSRIGAILAGLSSLLLTINILEAITTQVDQLSAAFLMAGVYFFLLFNRTSRWADGLLGAIGIGLALGLKSSNFLPLPALATVVIGHRLAIGKLWHRQTIFIGIRATFLVVAATAILAVPYGFWGNYCRWGNINGPEPWRTYHSVEGRPTEEIRRGGLLNAVRFSAEWLSLDGLPSNRLMFRLNNALRKPLGVIAKTVHLDPEEPTLVRQPFVLNKAPVASEDTSGGGVLGWLLLMPAVLLAMFGLFGRGAPVRMGWTLLVAAALFLLVQCFAAPYDYYRGRYFMILTALFCPMAGLALDRLARNWLGAVWLCGTFVVGISSALTTLLMPLEAPLAANPAVANYNADRCGQLCARNPAMGDTFRNFEKLVPSNARVAIAFMNDDYEYPAFGKGLTRFITPVTERLNKPGDRWWEDSQYLLYRQEFVPRLPGDVFLGHDLGGRSYWLRTLPGPVTELNSSTNGHE